MGLLQCFETTCMPLFNIQTTAYTHVCESFVICPGLHYNVPGHLATVYYVLYLHNILKTTRSFGGIVSTWLHNSFSDMCLLCAVYFLRKGKNNNIPCLTETYFKHQITLTGVNKARALERRMCFLYTYGCGWYIECMLRNWNWLKGKLRDTVTETVSSGILLPFMIMI